MRRLVYAIALLLACSNVASADVRIEASTGGKALFYLALFESLRESGQRIVIDGPCLSACALVLVTIPRSRICVTRRAILVFMRRKWSTAMATNLRIFTSTNWWDCDVPTST